MGVPPDLIASRWLFFLAAAILFGTALFPFYALREKPAVAPQLSHRTLTATASLALAAATAWLFALSHELEPAHSLLSVAKIVLTETNAGPVILARLVFAAAALASVLARWPAPTLVCAAGMLACEGWDGHAAAHGVFGHVNQALHVLCVGVWFGGLFALAKIVARDLRRGAPLQSLRPVQCFSDIAAGAVALLVLTGVVNALLLGPAISPSSAYARLLGIKLSLFALMFGLAAYNRLRLVPRLVQSEPKRPLRALLLAIACEQVLGAAILLAVAALGLLDPYVAAM